MISDHNIHENNESDVTAMVLKGAAGMIPILGGFVSEIVGNIIPNQRIDRIALFAEALNAKFENLSDEMVDKLRNNPLFIDLVEESCIRASRALTEERRRYIVSVVEHGMSDEDVDINNSKYVLGLLSDINDSEVIWLRYYHESTIADKQDFQRKHPNILGRIQTVLGDSIDKKRLAAIQESYTEHLERLGLIDRKIRMNSSMNVPEYDTFTNKPKISHTDTTMLGKMLLEYVGLIDPQPTNSW